MENKRYLKVGMSFKWDEEVDGSVVDSSFAGLSSAIEVKYAGASVVILEKMKGFGGN